MKIALLRHTGYAAKAEQEITRSLELDPLNFAILYERHLLGGDSDYQKLMRENAHNYVEISLDYLHAGLFDKAIALLSEFPQPDPMVSYYLGFCYLQSGDLGSAKAIFAGAATLPPGFWFPNRIECVPVLESAMQHHPHDARAPYYLGNFWYAHRQYAEAVAAWEKSARLDAAFATVHRNLGLAYVNKHGDLQRGIAAYQKAFACDQNDARVFFELDRLYKKLNENPEQRLQRIEQHIGLVNQRDDLMIEYISLLNLIGRLDDALNMLLKRRFHPWEGGEGKVTGQYVISLVELAKRKLHQGDFSDAIAYLKQAQTCPPNLGEGKLIGAQENNIFYYLGCAYQQLGEAENAYHYFLKASAGLSEPASAMYYNDQPPDMIFYRGKACEKLGDDESAHQIFQKLIDYGFSHLDDDIVIDYFAVSLPDFLVFDEDLNKRNRIHCHYMMALGCLGLGRDADAAINFDTVLSLDVYHTGAVIHRAMLSI